MSTRILLAAAIAVLAAAQGAGACVEYDIVFKGFEAPEGQMIELEEVELQSFNDTAILNNVTANVKENLPEDAVVCVDGYEWMGQSYQKGSMNLPCTNICKLTADDECAYTYVEQSSGGTLPKAGQPFKKGKIQITNYLLQIKESCLPSKMSGDEKKQFKLFIKDKNEKKIFYQTTINLEFPKKQC